MSNPVPGASAIRSTHHHVAPYLAEGADQMSVMIVVHLPQRGGHARHEAPLEKEKARSIHNQVGIEGSAKDGRKCL